MPPAIRSIRGLLPAVPPIANHGTPLNTYVHKSLINSRRRAAAHPDALTSISVGPEGVRGDSLPASSPQDEGNRISFQEHQGKGAE